jgi:AcrR family transcriptional regulator
MTDSQSVTDRATSRRKDRRRNRRKQLIAASRKLFLKRGFGETSVSAIVSAAGVAQGTFYLYFESKSDVLLYMRADVLEDYLRSFEAGLSGHGPADERLVLGIQAIQTSVDRHRPIIRVFREATTSDELSRVWVAGREALAVPLGRLIEEGVGDGSFRVEDAAMSAMLMLSLYDDLLYEAYEYEKPAPPAETLRASLAFLLRALGVGDRRITDILPPRKEASS